MIEKINPDLVHAMRYPFEGILAAQANPAKATPAEIKAVFVVQEAGAECRKIALEGFVGMYNFAREIHASVMSPVWRFMPRRSAGRAA